MNPLIGITSRTKMENEEIYDGVPRAYAGAIETAGGLPLLLPLIRNDGMYQVMCSILDGLLVNGDADVDPKLYGEKPEHSCGKPDKEKDKMEMKLIKWALEKNVPILGICRGHQLLTVACGGTLYQDIPNQKVQHRPDKQDSESLHLIFFENHTKLMDIFDMELLAVNSHHHQAIKDLPSDFKISAWAEDGAIEGIEKKDDHFVVGVQFHPEEMWEEHPEIKPLFTAFVSAAREYRLLKSQRE
ncbi:MAG: gamma-glutamyl-gamma-aminobutyrate hydrolase family protein [bacterium]